MWCSCWLVLWCKYTKIKLVRSWYLKWQKMIVWLQLCLPASHGIKSFFMSLGCNHLLTSLFADDRIAYAENPKGLAIFFNPCEAWLTGQCSLYLMCTTCWAWDVAVFEELDGVGGIPALCSPTSCTLNGGRVASSGQWTVTGWHIHCGRASRSCHAQPSSSSVAGNLTMCLTSSRWRRHTVGSGASPHQTMCRKCTLIVDTEISRCALLQQWELPTVIKFLTNSWKQFTRNMNDPQRAEKSKEGVLSYLMLDRVAS